MKSSAPLFLFLPIAAMALISSTAAGAQIGGGYENPFQGYGNSTEDHLGSTVANAGDINNDGYDDILIAANGMDPFNQTDAGAVIAFSGLDGSPLFQWNGHALADNFGQGLASAGDINGDGYADVIIGAPGANSHGYWWSGATFVFSGADGLELFQWQGVNQDDNFGGSVANAGDVNGDGTNDIIVGAIGTNYSGQPWSGSAFVYSGADGSLIYRWDGTDYYQKFANSVAGVGDVNGDGFDDVLVGSRDEGASVTGGAYLYSGADGSLLHHWVGEATADYFGNAVAAAGDVNADGYPDILIGAWETDLGGTYDIGSAYVFSGFDFSQIYKWSGQNATDLFGRSVSTAGDVNGDGFDDVLVGQGRHSGCGCYSGAVSLFSGFDGSLFQKWIGEVDGDRFGASVAGGGDIDGNGYADFIVGAPNADSLTQTEAGFLTVFSFQPYMYTDMTTVSVTTGGTMNIEIDFPSETAGYQYRVLMSAMGTGPTMYGIEIPLAYDSIARLSYIGRYPMTNYSDLHGTLDAQGDASAWLDVPANLPSGAVGHSYWLATVCNQPLSSPQYTSIALQLTFTP